jgi:hypothetical protein
MLSDLNAFMKKNKQNAVKPNTSKAQTNNLPMVFDPLIKSHENESRNDTHERIINIASNNTSNNELDLNTQSLKEERLVSFMKIKPSENESR